MLYRVSLQKNTQPTCRPTQLSWGAPAGIGSRCSSCAGTFCTWLFDVLAEAEKRIDADRYDAYNGRVYGFLAERLLDVWMETNHIAYTELPVVFLENQHWLKKGTAFLSRKIRYRRP